MATHVLRPRYWAEQLERLLPTLRNNDTLLVPDLYCKAAIDLQFDNWGIDKVIHVRDQAVKGTAGDGAECLRCRWLISNGFRQYHGIGKSCECGLHTQECPALWRDIEPAEWEMALSRSPGLSQLHPIAEYGREPCNCGGDAIARMFTASTYQETG